MHIKSILENEPGIAGKAKKLRLNPDLAFPVLMAKVKLTWRCNLRCRMCNLWRMPKEKSGDLPFETVRDLLASLKEQGTRKVHFSGGEALLVDHFRQTAAFARSLGMQVNITTNGTLIDKEMARFLVNERVHTVTVSLDSPDRREHDRIRGKEGAFNASWKGIERLQDRKEKKGRGPRVAVNTVVTRHNIDSMESMYRLLTQKRIDSWRILPIDTEIKKMRPTGEQWLALCEKLPAWDHILARFPLDWSSKRSGERAEGGKFAGLFYSENTCFAPWFNLFVDADGKAYPCCMGKQDMTPYGNVRDTPVHELLAGGNRRDICCSMASGNPFPVCHRCDDFLEENAALNGLWDSQGS